jgi:iron complex transport system ATP-binding protein
MILSVSDIRYSYNSHPVLDNVTFELKSHKILGLLGINGAGKSTLLKCLNRILKPDSGSIILDGKNLIDMNRQDVAQEVGYAPQKAADSKLTVFESVLLGRKPHMQWSFTDADYSIVEDIIRRLGLESKAHKPLDELSGGELQKTVIARAIAQSPKVLLLDEPTNNLDLKNQIEVMGLIRKYVISNDLSAVISIHDLNLALRFADKFLLLKDHKIYSAVSKEELTAELIREVYDIEVLIGKVENLSVIVPIQ